MVIIYLYILRVQFNLCFTVGASKFLQNNHMNKRKAIQGKNYHKCKDFGWYLQLDGFHGVYSSFYFRYSHPWQSILLYSTKPGTRTSLASHNLKIQLKARVLNLLGAIFSYVSSLTIRWQMLFLKYQGLSRRGILMSESLSWPWSHGTQWS